MAAQSSSLFGNPDQRRPLSLSEVSWTYQSPEPKREIHINDLITVNVNEMATVISGGKIDQQRQAEGNWTLKSWIIPSPNNFGIKPDPQTAGSPNIDGTVNNTYRANADLQSKESVKFKLACHVVSHPPQRHAGAGRPPHDRRQRNELGSVAGRVDPAGGRGAQQQRLQ